MALLTGKDGNCKGLYTPQRNYKYLSQFQNNIDGERNSGKLPMHSGIIYIAPSVHMKTCTHSTDVCHKSP